MATGRSVAGAHLHVIKSGEALPFPDGYFASASCLDVLEHVVDQVGMLRELRRVIEPLNGFLVVTVPKQHVLSFLDTGNIKFRTPRLHHLAYRVAGRDHIYRERFVQMTGGLFGDMEPGKNWHQHFTVEQLTSLIERNRFRVEEFDGAGLFHRALRLLEVTTPLRARGIIGRVVRADEHRFASTHLFCVARPTE
jgi:SAM-dependent methyltransferase